MSRLYAACWFVPDEIRRQVATNMAKLADDPRLQKATACEHNSDQVILDHVVRPRLESAVTQVFVDSRIDDLDTDTIQWFNMFISWGGQTMKHTQSGQRRWDALGKCGRIIIDEVRRRAKSEV